SCPRIPSLKAPLRPPKPLSPSFKAELSFRVEGGSISERGLERAPGACGRSPADSAHSPAQRAPGACGRSPVDDHSPADSDRSPADDRRLLGRPVGGGPAFEADAVEEQPGPQERRGA